VSGEAKEELVSAEAIQLEVALWLLGAALWF
jgi:hypothetical protein